MGQFGYVVSPHTTDDIVRRYAALRLVPASLVEAAAAHMRPLPIGKVQVHILPSRQVPASVDLAGDVVALPFTARLLERLPPPVISERVKKAAAMLGTQDVRVIGFLGGIAASGLWTVLARQLSVPVTLGEAGRLWALLQAVEGLLAAQGKPLGQSTVAILGADRPAGRVAALLLAPKVESMWLIGAAPFGMQRLAAEIMRHTGLSPLIAHHFVNARPLPHIVFIAAAGYWQQIGQSVEVPGTVCDLVRATAVPPPAVPGDSVVIRGGLVSVPGSVHLPPALRLPDGKVTGAMAEVILRALAPSGRWGHGGLPANVSAVAVVASLARRYDFRVTAACGTTRGGRVCLPVAT